MKKVRLLMACLILTGVPFACDDFSEINKNPNQPDINADYNFQEAALGSIFRSSVPAIEGDDEQRVKSLMVDFYAQMLDGGNFPTRYYQMTDDWSARMYRRVQTSIANMNLVLRGLAESPDQEMVHNAKAVTMLWRVWIAAVGVDWFGPIPFANYEGAIVENPAYRSVEDIYTEFFAELDKVNTMLSAENTNPIFRNSRYDILFQNDKEKWRRFSNSLHLRLAMRLTEVDDALAGAEAAKAIAAGVMQSAANNAKLPTANGGWGQDYNYTMFQISWGGPLNMTTSMEKLLTGIGGMDFPADVKNKRSNKPLSAVHPAKVDPRGPVMFDPANQTGDWKGRPDGLNLTSHPELDGTKHESVDFAEVGFLYSAGQPFKNRPYDILLYEEVCFLQAEAAVRKYIPEAGAKTWYEAGVNASFATWGVAPKAADYLASTAKNLAGTSANFDDNTGNMSPAGAGTGNTMLEKIITQKYLALFPDMSQEAWNDKRRLNLPRTDVAMDRFTTIWPTSSTNVNDVSNFIKRVQYPSAEVQGNQTNYEAGVALLGGVDRVNTRIWWDTGKSYLTSPN